MKPDDIEQDVWDQALRYMDAAGWYMTSVRIGCARAIKAERNRCAGIIEKRLQEIVDEHGDYEPDTNYTNLPEWAESLFEEVEPLIKDIKEPKP